MAYKSVWEGIRPQKVVAKTFSQTGKRKSMKRDLGRKAKRPGWRISKSGKLYYEGRANRTDLPGKRL